MQENRIIEEISTLQNNEVAEENVVCQSNAEEEESLSCQDNAVIEEFPKLQDNIIVEETSKTTSVPFVDEVLTPPTLFEEEQTVKAAEYSEEVPNIQDNTIDEESTTESPVIPGEEDAPEDTTPRTDISGSVAISKDVTVGGHARIGDDTLFKRNVTVEGWLEANNVRGKLKEWLDNLEELAKDAKDTAEEGTVSVQILTDKGNVIFNGEGQRILTARVFHRGEDVTDRIYEGRFSWKRISNDLTGDRIWNRLHEGKGNVCTVTDEDVDRNAVFSCEVDISETWLDTDNENE